MVINIIFVRMRIKVKTSHVASQYRLQILFYFFFFFALTSMSSRDFPFFVRDDQRFVEIVFSKGWLCSRLQCSINICFRILTAGWYIVTKRNKRSWPFGFSVCVRADCLEAKLTPDGDHDVFRVHVASGHLSQKKGKYLKDMLTRAKI